jgi:PTS system cellobiose-specific IIC component
MQHIKSGAFISFVNKLTAIAGKLSAQRHLNAVRESFVVLMPLIIVATFFILINNVILHQNGLMGVFGITGA